MELRIYEPHLIAETEVTGSFEDSGKEGFRRLAGYIFGGNQGERKIQMTAPVGQKGMKIAMTAPVGLKQEVPGQFKVTFTMPRSFTTLESLPVPNDPRVHLVEVGSRFVAAFQYSGTWSQERFQSRKTMLKEWIRKHGWKEAGEADFARYNAPWTPWFLRRNEILIPVDPGEGMKSGR
jgi:hypothetical protein